MKSANTFSLNRCASECRSAPITLRKCAYEIYKDPWMHSWCWAAVAQGQRLVIKRLVVRFPWSAWHTVCIKWMKVIKKNKKNIHYVIWGLMIKKQVKFLFPALNTSVLLMSIPLKKEKVIVSLNVFYEPMVFVMPHLPLLPATSTLLKHFCTCNWSGVKFILMSAANTLINPRSHEISCCYFIYPTKILFT